MGEAYDANEMNTQITQVNRKLSDQISLANEILRAIDDFAYTTELNSTSFLNLKTRMQNVHGSIWRGIQLCSQAIIDANNRLVSKYFNEVGETYINTDGIFGVIEFLQMQVNYLRSMQHFTNVANPLIYTYMNQIRILENKIDSLNLYDNQSNGIFDEAQQYLNQINTALSQLSQDDWNPNLGTFSSTISMDWAKEIERLHKAKLMQSFYTDGRLNEKGKTYFSSVMKKDKYKMSLFELDIVSDMLATAHLDDIPVLLDLGYSVSLDKEKLKYTGFSDEPIVGPSDSFLLALAIAQKKLNDISLTSFDDKTSAFNGDNAIRWVDHLNHVMFVQAMISTVNQMPFVEDLRRIETMKSLFTISKNGDKGYTIASIRSSNNILTFESIGSGKFGEANQIENHIHHVEGMNRAKWLFGLATYFPGIGESLGYAMTVQDGLEAFGILSEEHRNLNSVEYNDETLQQWLGRQDSRSSSNNDALTNAKMLDDYGLHGYRVGDNYYYTISSDTKEQLEFMNDKIVLLSEGIVIDTTEINILDIEKKIRVLNNENDYNISYKIENNVLIIDNLIPIEMEEFYTNPKKVEMYLDITTELGNVLPNHPKPEKEETENE